MNDLRFYTFEGILLAIVHDAVTVNWRICYNDVGTFEGHFNFNSSFVSEVISEPWLLVQQGDLQAIITGRQIGKELVFYGKTPNWLLCKRVISPFVTSDITSEKGVTVQKVSDWVMSKAFDETDSMITEEKEGPFSETVFPFFRTSANQAFEVIRDCAEREQAGHRVWFEPETATWHFQIYKGTELPYMLSDDQRNTYETEYTENISELADAGWYGREIISRGDYDPVSNQPPLKQGLSENFGKYYQIVQSGVRFSLTMKAGQYLVCDSSDGMWRIADGEEIQNMDCIWVRLKKDTEQTGIYRWESVLSAQTESEAESELTGKKKEQSITLMSRNLEYGSDYSLGDIAYVQKVAGQARFTQKKQITAVTIWYEQGNFGQQPEFSE